MSIRAALAGRRSTIAFLGAVAALTVWISPPALAATAGADINDQSLENYSWKGWAVDMNRTWHYSWAIHLQKNSSTIDSHTTSTTTPTYTNFIDPRVWGGKPYCTTFNLHHGTTVSSPLDSTYTACVPEQGIAPPVPPPPDAA